MPLSWLERSQAEIAGALALRLSGRPGSAFRGIGEEACRGYADAALAALREDISSGRREAVRAAMQALVEELSAKGLTFADLRFFAQTLRGLVGGALAGEPESADRRRQIDDWFFELVLIGTMRFVARREEILQERAAKHEVERLESQLAELRAAFAEKTRLLEVIRQASTPIAPVVEGILVVPLVGMFDAFRAELLTEKLLQEVSRARARVVILDISGVPVFDADAAQRIVRLAGAVRLLGTELLLVGVSSKIAATIVDLGIDLTGLKTLGTLQDGLAQALVMLRLKIAPL